MPEVKMEKLKEAIIAINDSGEIEPAITIVGLDDDVLVTQFTDAVEALNEAERDVPTIAIEVYNALYSEEEETETEPEKKPAKKPAKKPVAKAKAAPKKKAAVKAAPKKKATVTKEPKENKKSTVKKDDFGYTVGSKANLFAKSINNKTGKTMKEVKELEWNDKFATFYDTFNRLVEKGLAEKDEKTNKMKIIK